MNRDVFSSFGLMTISHLDGIELNKRQLFLAHHEWTRVVQIVRSDADANRFERRKEKGTSR